MAKRKMDLHETVLQVRVEPYCFNGVLFYMVPVMLGNLVYALVGQNQFRHVLVGSLWTLYLVSLSIFFVVNWRSSKKVVDEVTKKDNGQNAHN